jgi:hypothetical protein
MSNDLNMLADAATNATGPDSLDRALRQIIVPPSVPPDFRSKVMAMIQSDVSDLEARRSELQAQYQREVERLQSGYVQLRRDRLAAVIASTFAMGVCASLLGPWLYEQVGSDVSLTLPLVAAVIGMAAGASVWIERFGRVARP